MISGIIDKYNNIRLNKFLRFNYNKTIDKSFIEQNFVHFSDRIAS